jgi:hypothetical protein
MATEITIARPQVDPMNYQYADGCRSALEPWVDLLMRGAVSAGWRRDEAAYALMILGSRKFKEAWENASAEDNGSRRLAA